MLRFTKKILLTILLSLALLNVSHNAKAQTGIVISPKIIDETAQARDIFNYEVNIANNTERKVELYAVVNEVNADGSIASSTRDLDRAVSLRKWIKIIHGVIELMPGESTTVDLEINVSQFALPGQRYAAISLINSPDRYAAERKAVGRSFGDIFLSFNIEENIVEKAQIAKFETTKNIYVKPEVAFDINISNFGNRDIFPLGTIYVFDRRGQVVAEIPVDSKNQPVLAGSELEQSINWNEVKGIGKYKAKLEVKYGQNDFELMDTIYFWYLPWQILAGFLAVIFLLMIVLIIILFKKGFSHHHVSDTSELDVGPGVINLRGRR
jgi:hypothetical protein